LFTTPVVYLYLDRLQDWLSGHKKHEAEPEDAPEQVLSAAE
jgi:hypothetical protein